MTRAVLGIDAAWTGHKPSGLAVAVEDGGRWRLVDVAPSYAAFLERRGFDPANSPPQALVGAVLRLVGAAPSVVAVDMPLALGPISGRRAADNAVSRAYGGRKCSTHSPNADRPGIIAEQLTSRFVDLGYRLALDEIRPPALIEVYPHPALVELLGASERLPYKVAKARAYWPDLDPGGRRRALTAVFARAVAALDREISGVEERLRPPDPAAPSRVLKAFEDQLDAVVCAWVGIRALEDRAQPFGDDVSAIWIPQAA